ncbi:MAG: hypothetical protein KUL86_11215 [Castellaniella sp.]|nr:hypothetical protein [Castellaniella sp.]
MKHAICALFEVHPDEAGVQRVVTPLEYGGSGDHVVVRVRPTNNGYQIDENGEAALYASMADGDPSAESVLRWAQDLSEQSPVHFSEDEILMAFARDERLISSYIFRVAESAQQFYALATSRPPRRISDFKEQVSKAVASAAASTGFDYESDVQLGISGDFVADHVISSTEMPIIIIAASGIQRLLEAEIIHMQYRAEKVPAMVIAAVESQKSVGGAKQYERANYYTGKTVTFNASDFGSLIKSYVQ